MNRILFSSLSLLTIGMLGTPALLQAQSTGHYVGGLEGIKGASLPPPGWYIRDYNLFYTADRINDAKGNRITLADPDIFVYAQVPRLLWITETKVFGGYLGFDVLVPLIENSLEVNTPIGRFDDDNFGVGDLFGEVTLSWHLPRLDFSFGVGLWAPTGNSSPAPSTDADWATGRPC